MQTALCRTHASQAVPVRFNPVISLSTLLLDKPYSHRCIFNSCNAAAAASFAPHSICRYLQPLLCSRRGHSRTSGIRCQGHYFGRSHDMSI